MGLGDIVGVLKVLYWPVMAAAVHNDRSKPLKSAGGKPEPLPVVKRKPGAFPLGITYRAATLSSTTAP